MERFKRLLVLSLIISIVFLVAVTLFTVGPETLPILLSIEPVFLLAAVAAHVGSYIVWGMRMKVMAGALGHHISIVDATEAVLSNLLAASITPSMAGGEPVRIHHLSSRGGIPVGDASAVVIGERVLDALMLLVLSPIALWILHRSLISWEMDAVIIIAEVFVILLVGLALIGLLSPVFIDRLSALITGGLHRVRIFRRVEHVIEFIDRELLNFHNSLWSFIKTGQKELLLGMVCTIVFWILEFGILLFILLGLNHNPDILMVFAVQVLLTLIMVLPITPGASGIAEVGGAALFGLFIPVSILGIVVVIWRLITYYLNIIIGGIVSVKILKDIDLLRKT